MMGAPIVMLIQMGLPVYTMYAMYVMWRYKANGGGAAAAAAVGAQKAEL